MAQVGGDSESAFLAAVATQLADASADETAAIASAINVYLSDREWAAVAAAAAADERPSWEGRAWSFAGRLEGNRRPARRRVHRDAPSDPWTAAGRADRF